MGANGEILKIAAKYACWLRAPVVLFLYLVTDHKKGEFGKAKFSNLFGYTLEEKKKSLISVKFRACVERV